MTLSQFDKPMIAMEALCLNTFKRPDTVTTPFRLVQVVESTFLGRPWSARDNRGGLLWRDAPGVVDTAWEHCR